MDALQSHFKPEFLNRIDETIIFHNLSQEQLGEIVDIQVERLARRLVEKNIDLVLSQSAKAFIAEKVSYAAEMVENNPPLYEKVKRIFAASDHEPIPHEVILSEMAAKAKVIVRTGAFDPWGNILLYSGADAPVWFSKPGLKVPEVYQQRVEQMKKGS